MLLSTQNIHMDYLGLCPGVLCQHCWGAVGDRRKSHFSVLQLMTLTENIQMTPNLLTDVIYFSFLLFCHGPQRNLSKAKNINSNSKDLVGLF